MGENFADHIAMIDQALKEVVSFARIHAAYFNALLNESVPIDQACAMTCSFLAHAGQHSPRDGDDTE